MYQKINRCKRSSPGTAPAKRSEPEEILPWREIEKLAILRALRIFDWNLARAAKALEIGRVTIYRKMGGYGIAPTHN